MEEGERRALKMKEKSVSQAMWELLEPGKAPHFTGNKRT